MKILLGAVSAASLALALAAAPAALLAGGPGSGSTCNGSVDAAGMVHCTTITCTNPCAPTWIPPQNQTPPPVGNKQVMFCVCPNAVNSQVCSAGATWDFDQTPPVFVSADCWHSIDQNCPPVRPVCKKTAGPPTTCDCVE